MTPSDSSESPSGSTSDAPSGAGDTVLDVRAATKDFGDGLGLTEVDLAVHGGEVVMLVGPNGAGKSTLLGLVGGLVEPTEGEILVAGSPAGSEHARAACSSIPDTPALYPDLSVREHLEYVAGMHGVADWEDYAEDLLDMFALIDRADDLPSRFSRGMRQKTALCTALVRPFTLLCIDEPFAGLDRPAQEALLEVIAEVAEQGAAVVVSTHQQDLLAVATRCVGLRDGQVIHDGEVSAEVVRTLVEG
ncbi:MAG: ABC transporter ATP-binding protein [Acidimicrobiia bacterium]|nr:ABC transporter ATP-binding protein [Acidimicrobiia bacterium]